MKISISEFDGLPVVALEAELDCNTSRKLEQVLSDMIDNGAYRIIIDFTGVSHLSATGTGTLVSALKKNASSMMETSLSQSHQDNRR